MASACDRRGDRLHALEATAAQHRAKDISLQRFGVESVEKRGIGQNLSHHRAARLSVLGELDLDKHQSAGRFYSEEIRIFAAEWNLAAEDRQTRCTREREEMRCVFDQTVERCFSIKGRGLQPVPSLDHSAVTRRSYASGAAPTEKASHP